MLPDLPPPLNKSVLVCGIFILKPTTRYRTQANEDARSRFSQVAAERNDAYSLEQTVADFDRAVLIVA
jgi:hypothetical protein